MLFENLYGQWCRQQTILQSKPFQTPTADNKQPPTDNKQPTTDNKQPTTDNRPWPSNKGLPTDENLSSDNCKTVMKINSDNCKTVMKINR